jgi:hypothetical protein
MAGGSLSFQKAKNDKIVHDGDRTHDLSHLNADTLAHTPPPQKTRISKF